MKAVAPYIVVIIVLAALVWWLWPKPGPNPPVPPTVVITQEKPHVRSEGAEAGRLADEDVSGLLVVEISIPGTDSLGKPLKPIRVEIEIPRDDEQSPIVHTATPGSVRATYQDFRDPVVSPSFRFMVGASADPTIGPSPFGGMTVLRVAEDFYAGAGADRFGAGPIASWQFFREFNVGVKYNLVRFREASRWDIIIGYLF